MKYIFYILYLGDHGVYTGSSGLKMVYISGKQKELLKPNQVDVGFSVDAIKSIEVQVANSPNGVDLLLTSQWPKGVENLAVNLVCLISLCSLVEVILLLQYLI